MKNRYKSRETGFTLVELMIVVAIIGILASIALPVYQRAIIRSHVMEGFSLISNVKFAVYEYYYWQHQWPADNTAAGVAPAHQITGTSTKSVAIHNGSIIVTYNENAVPNKTIIFSPSEQNGSILWDCSLGTLPQIYRPPECR